jgi:hypothetical protein
MIMGSGGTGNHAGLFWLEGNKLLFCLAYLMTLLVAQILHLRMLPNK